MMVTHEARLIFIDSKRINTAVRQSVWRIKDYIYTTMTHVLPLEGLCVGCLLRDSV